MTDVFLEWVRGVMPELAGLAFIVTFVTIGFNWFISVCTGGRGKW